MCVCVNDHFFYSSKILLVNRKNLIKKCIKKSLSLILNMNILIHRQIDKDISPYMRSQVRTSTGCNPEDLPEAMNDREKWRETVRDIRAGGAT